MANAATADQAQQAAKAAGTLDALRAAISGFTGCAVRDTAANTILPEGDLGARLILISESPTANDDRAGRIFASTEGEFLEKALASIGLARADCLIAPLLPWRPPGDRPPSQSELAVCLPFLWRLLALAKGQHALVLGPVATKALIGASKRLKRGAWSKIDVPDRSGMLDILASVSIAQTKRTPAMKRELWTDLRQMYRAIHPNITQK